MSIRLRTASSSRFAPDHSERRGRRHQPAFVCEHNCLGAFVEGKFGEDASDSSNPARPPLTSSSLATSARTGLAQARLRGAVDVTGRSMVEMVIRSLPVAM